MYDHIEDFIDVGVVEVVGAGTNRYRLNQESDVANLLCKLDGVVLQSLAEIESVNAE